jgi:peptidoglycan/LPS O-acetylase OafA/YrhL
MFWVIWCAGALLAEGVKTDRLPRWRPWFGAAAVVLFMVAMATSVTKQYIGLQETIWASVYFMLLLWGLTHKNPMGWLPRPVVASSLFLSLVSYSLYLIHFPLFKLAGTLWVSFFGSKPANFFVALGLSALAVLVAYGFFIAIEKPTQRATLWLSSRLAAAR